MDRATVITNDHTNALLTALSAAPFPIGDAVAPRNPDKSEIPPPFAVLYSLPGGIFDGPLNNSQIDVHFIYQITAVAPTREQAEVVRDICRGLMKKSNISIPGRRVRDLRHQIPNSGIRRDDDLPNPLFYGYDRYVLDTTPA